MSRELRIGNKVFNYPENGTNPEEAWGPDATDWASAVTEALEVFYGPNDIPITSAVILNNKTTPTNIQGLAFNLSAVQFAEITYTIKRGSVYESGKILAQYNGSGLDFTVEHTGDAGIVFSESGGQFKYTSSDSVIGTIRFKATTIDQQIEE